MVTSRATPLPITESSLLQRSASRLFSNEPLVEPTQSIKDITEDISAQISPLGTPRQTPQTARRKNMEHPDHSEHQSIHRENSPLSTTSISTIIESLNTRLKQEKLITSGKKNRHLKSQLDPLYRIIDYMRQSEMASKRTSTKSQNPPREEQIFKLLSHIKKGLTENDPTILSPENPNFDLFLKGVAALYEKSRVNEKVIGEMVTQNTSWTGIFHPLSEEELSAMAQTPDWTIATASNKENPHNPIAYCSGKFPAEPNDFTGIDWDETPRATSFLDSLGEGEVLCFLDVVSSKKMALPVLAAMGEKIREKHPEKIREIGYEIYAISAIFDTSTNNLIVKLPPYSDNVSKRVIHEAFPPGITQKIGVKRMVTKIGKYIICIDSTVYTADFAALEAMLQLLESLP